jgi:hypothetical protein
MTASRERLPHGWADWEAFRKRHARTFIRWAEPPPRDSSEERYAIMKSDDHPGAHVIWARVSPSPDVSFQRSQGGFYTIPEEGKKAIPWAVEAAMAHKRKMRGLTARDSTRRRSQSQNTRRTSPVRTHGRTSRDPSATRAADRPWRVRDRLTRHRYYFESRPEALAFVDNVSTSEITGEPLARWRDRLIVERNRDAKNTK